MEGRFWHNLYTLLCNQGGSSRIEKWYTAGDHLGIFFFGICGMNRNWNQKMKITEQQREKRMDDNKWIIPIFNRSGYCSTVFRSDQFERTYYITSNVMAMPDWAIFGETSWLTLHIVTMTRLHLSCSKLLYNISNTYLYFIFILIPPWRDSGASGNIGSSFGWNDRNSVAMTDISLLIK